MLPVIPRGHKAYASGVVFVGATDWLWRRRWGRRHRSVVAAWRHGHTALRIPASAPFGIVRWTCYSSCLWKGLSRPLWRGHR